MFSNAAGQLARAGSNFGNPIPFVKAKSEKATPIVRMAPVQMRPVKVFDQKT